jgi:hypothetical protein
MEAGAIPQHTATAAINTAVGPDYSILCHAVEINLQSLASAELVRSDGVTFANYGRRKSRQSRSGAYPCDCLHFSAHC